MITRRPKACSRIGRFREEGGRVHDRPTVERRDRFGAFLPPSEPDRTSQNRPEPYLSLSCRAVAVTKSWMRLAFDSLMRARARS